MQILISDAILSDPNQWHDLESLLDRARHNRCYVNALNPASSSTNPWFAQVDQRRQQDWLNAIAWADLDASIYRLRSMIADAATDPAARPFPKLLLREAIDLVDRPTQLWVENDRNDRRFWLSMMPPDQRAMFLEYERRKIFQFQSRGGLGELRKALAELASRGDLDPRKDWAMFDSDGEVPGHRSSAAIAMVDFCVQVQLGHHCLSRRAIENYIPQAAMWAWALNAQPKRIQTERRKTVTAFYCLSQEQRNHFRLKAGWGASPSTQEIAFYATVSDTNREALTKGFDSDIALVYDRYNEQIYHWASMEGLDTGVQATIEAITNWIRVPYA